MVKAVQELESGIDAETVARNHGISKATLYNWKSKYSGMEVSQVRRLKELEAENRKLKQMYAELALDNKILKDAIDMNSAALIADNSNRQECCVRVLIPTAVWSRLSKYPPVVGMSGFNFIRNTQERFLIPIHCLWLLSRV